MSIIASHSALVQHRNNIKKKKKFRLSRQQKWLDQRYTDRSPHDLSGGQKQRVSLAGILVDDVDILLFDEPLASL
ncbi:ATP-binding cassette domain-containing protein [Vibrio chagasii]|nr:ATP-binding cassette domain-containing protein [Vibrio chagasii]